MPKVYEFKEFPERLGFVVGKDETIHEAVNEALLAWGKGAVHVANIDTHLEGGTIRLVREFPDTNEGWDRAFALAFELEEY